MECALDQSAQAITLARSYTPYRGARTATARETIQIGVDDGDGLMLLDGGRPFPSVDKAAEHVMKKALFPPNA
jgi:hypothetical protein